MQIDTATPTDHLSNQAIIERCSETRQTDENADPPWPLLSRPMQEPIVWPRVFPGL
ncbi:MAG TPA: hypothetical protein VKQ27_09090 [Acetobacteraceae bacterium]|nr:hypothetical protein [Acetobacteraceae bacterium]